MISLFSDTEPQPINLSQTVFPYSLTELPALWGNPQLCKTCSLSARSSLRKTALPPCCALPRPMGCFPLRTGYQTHCKIVLFLSFDGREEGWCSGMVQTVPWLFSCESLTLPSSVWLHSTRWCWEERVPWIEEASFPEISSKPFLAFYLSQTGHTPTCPFLNPILWLRGYYELIGLGRLITQSMISNHWVVLI